MELLKINYQLCYVDPRNAKGIAMNLILFGYKQFSETYLFKNQKELKLLSESISKEPPNIESLTLFAFNNLIDSIRIHICIENFLKAIFLLNGIIIHKLDKQIFQDLFKKQTNTPVFLNEVVNISNWVKIPNLNEGITDSHYQIQGITEWTLGINTLLKNNYIKFIKLNQETVKLFTPFIAKRNKLHFYIEDNFSIDMSTYKNLEQIINFINLNLVPTYNNLIEELGKNETYKIKPLIISK